MEWAESERQARSNRALTTLMAAYIDNQGLAADFNQEFLDYLYRQDGQGRAILSEDERDDLTAALARVGLAPMPRPAANINYGQISPPSLPMTQLVNSQSYSVPSFGLPAPSPATMLSVSAPMSISSPYFPVTSPPLGAAYSSPRVGSVLK